MTADNKKIVEIYNTRVENLYAKIKGWFPEYSYNEKNISVTERNGSYNTPLLEIKNENKLIANLVPKGIWIIAAEGKLELSGSSGKESIVYLTEGGPTRKIEIKHGAGTEKYERKPFGNKSEGWHWLDDRILGKMPELTKDVFQNLLERVN